MVTIQSLLKVADDLVPVEEFAGPIVDKDYIEGAIVLSVGHTPILTRDMVDYVDQLWAYLIRGLEEVVAGREFSTFYPDMPLEIVLRPQGDRVVIMVDPREGGAEASVAIDELCTAMASAGTLFFERLRPFLPSDQALCDQYIARLAGLTSGGRDSEHELPR
jgi:hypothetical protein